MGKKRNLADTISDANKTIESQRFLVNVVIMVGGLYLSIVAAISTYQGYKVGEIKDNISIHIENKISSHIKHNNKALRKNDIKFYMDKELYKEDHTGVLVKLLQRGIGLSTEELSMFAEEVKKIRAQVQQKNHEKISWIRSILNILSQQDKNIIIDNLFKSIIYSPIKLKTDTMTNNYDLSYFDPIFKYIAANATFFSPEINHLLTKELNYRKEVQKVQSLPSRQRSAYKYKSIQITFIFYLSETSFKYFSNENRILINDIITIDPSVLSSFSNNYMFIQNILDKNVIKNMNLRILPNKHTSQFFRVFTKVNGKERSFSIKAHSPLLKKLQELSKQESDILNN